MTKRIVITFFVSILSLAFIALLVFSLFFTQKVNAAFDCLTLVASSSQSDKDYCRNELAQIEAQLADLLNKQKAQQKATGTLKGDVAYLTSQINALKTKIKARSLAIAQLKINIGEKVNKINTLSNKIDREYASLAQLLRNTNEFDSQNSVTFLLSNDSISGFYSDLESYNSIKQAIKNSVDVINGVKTQTEVEKQGLVIKQDAEADAKAELESAQKSTAKAEADKKQLLEISKQKEAAYKLLAAQKKAQADKIRAALFPLANSSTKIDFGTALAYANDVSNKLGIEPAFLLAILTQESNLGANVGQCYLTDPDTGAGVGKNTGTPFSNVMKPTRDVEPFMEITNALGLNTFKTAVSCPIAGVAGYGGAMGPAQFIPSTWKLFTSRLQDILGHYANPWSPKDSFMASGMYLTDLGAIGTSASAQNRAACKYYGSGGSTCSYSRSVASLKTKIQANIDLL
ncbi:MAG: lytic murein transglycosylase [Candidatus Pacebacteria bacterium]|nr:lytic murein transglycosylase [Candidatus Paceibacterota bacterium]